MLSTGLNICTLNLRLVVAVLVATMIVAMVANIRLGTFHLVHVARDSFLREYPSVTCLVLLLRGLGLKLAAVDVG